MSNNAMELNGPEDEGGEGIEIDLSDSGMLWLINRVCLHPRGFALAALYEDEAREGQPVSFTLIGDGSEVWGFPDEIDDEYFARAEATFETARAAARVRARGKAPE